MSPTTVLIIGCGVAGPVLAVMLKRKGYHPIVFERVRQLGDAGGSLMMMPNGLKVLELVGVVSELETETCPLEGFLDTSSGGEVLGFSDLPKSFKHKYGQHAMGVKRTTLNLKLKNMLLGMGIEVREGWELEDIEAAEDTVTAHFRGGRSAVGTFLIGCDGIKSGTRKTLLRKQGITEGLPPFSGLTQSGGFSPIPEAIKDKPFLRNCYGEGSHMVSYPGTKDVISWAITMPEQAGAEADWGLISAQEMDERKQKLLASIETWQDETSKELVRTATRMLKFGIFDRDEIPPDKWYTRRIVLVGDAAHPTSPHLGQGANQALEDCYHLSNALPSLPTDEKDKQAVLDDLQDQLQPIFQTFAQKRQPRTSALVRRARTQAQIRVVTAGPEACKERDNQVAFAWKDVDAVARRYDGLCREPF